MIAIIAGASGITGRALLKYLDTLDSWSMIALARGKFEVNTKAEFIAIDLLDMNSLQQYQSKFGGVTHIFYAAYYPTGSHFTDVTPNMAMLKNLVNVVSSASSVLERVVLVEGPKYYGVHLGSYKTPAIETDHRHMPPNFYYNQEDFLREQSKNTSISWSVLRPSLTTGFATASSMNILNIIAIYASISKELNLPLRFPGNAIAYTKIWEATDADLLAKTIVWAGANKNAENQAFNITNGDFFRWNQLWPKFAQFFGMDYAQPQSINLSEFMADKSEIWNQMIKKYNLKVTDYKKIAQWGYGDAAFNFNYDVMSSTTKLRLAGFHEFVDSETMFLQLFTEMRKDLIIP